MDNKQKFNYHTHTYRCGHAVLCEDEEYVKAAIEMGFETLGFSDHGPFNEYSKPGDRMEPEQFEGYLKSIQGLREKYKNQIDVRIGSEFEYFDEHLDQIEELSKKTEYLILGQHYPYPNAEDDFCRNSRAEGMIERYGYLVCKGMETGKFLYLAHPDYFCGGIDEFDEKCEKISHDICKTAVETGTPLEVNIKLDKRKPRLYNDGMFYAYPFREFWNIASKYPVKCVYGFDAHDPNTLRDMNNYRKADEILAGLKLEFIDLDIKKRI